MRNKERLDGLSESYFTPMSQEERMRAFNYLLKLVETGGNEESVHGLFRADQNRAIEPVKRLLEAGKLNGQAQIAAAWNLYKIQHDKNLLPIFIHFLSDPDFRLREKSAYYVPADDLTTKLKSGLQGMIRTETEQLARIHAVNKPLECYGVSKESVGKDDFSTFYKGLHSEGSKIKEPPFRQLDALFD